MIAITIPEANQTDGHTFSISRHLVLDRSAIVALKIGRDISLMGT
jgi:hypothetical protein